MRYSVQRGPTRRLLVSAATLLMMLAASLFLIDRAAAADVSGSVTTSVTVNTEGRTEVPPEYWEWQTIRMDIDWAVAPGATVHTGDHFDVPMDPNLNAGSFVPFDLTDGSGQVVAKAQLIASPAPGTIRFVFTDFVETHQNVSGTAYFRMGFTSMDWTTGEMFRDIDVYNSTVRVKRDLGPDGTGDWKSGWFQPNEAQALEIDENGALVRPDQSQIRWNIQLKTQAGNPLADWTTMTLTDTPAPGSQFRCGPADLNAQVRRRDVQGDPAVAYANFTVDLCQADRLVLTVTKAANDHGIFSVDFNGWLVLDAQNRPTYTDANNNPRIGFPPDGYGNSAFLDYVGVETVTRPTTLKRADQGGSGGGDNLVSRRSTSRSSRARGTASPS